MKRPFSAARAIPKSVIRRVCGQTLGLGLGQSKDIVVVIISLQWTKG